MDADRVLGLKIETDVSDIKNEGTKAARGWKHMAKEAKAWGAAFGKDLALDGISRVTDALNEGIAGFKSGRKVNTQFGNTWKRLGFDGKKLQKTIDKISSSTLALGTSDDEAVEAVNRNLKVTGNYNESLKRLTIAQDLVANGSAPNLGAAFKIVDKAAAGSKSTIDKFGLTSKTASGRVKELGDQVKGSAKKAAALDPMGVAMNGIGEAMETIAGVVAIPVIDEFGKVMRDTVAPAVTAFADALANGDVNAQVLALAGGIAVLAAAAYAHPLIALVAAIAALGVITAIAIKEDWFGKLAAGASEGREQLYANAGAVDANTRSVVLLQDTLSAGTDPISGFFDRVAEAWRGAQAIISGDFSNWGATMGALIEVILAPFLIPFEILWGLIKGGFNQMGINIDETIGDVRDSVVGIIQNAIGAIRDLWNSIDISVPAFNLHVDGFQIDTPAGPIGINPQDFQVWGGTGDLFPDVGTSRGGGPSGGRTGHWSRGGDGGAEGGSHEKGLWSVPFDGYAATLHRNEMVVPSDYADQLRANGGMGGGTTVNINVVVGPTSDKAAVGKAIVDAVSAYFQRSGNVRPRGWSGA